MKLRRGRADVELKLDYCLFAIEELRSPLAALATLRDIESAEPQITQRFLAFRYERLLKVIKVAKDDKDSAQQMLNIQQQSLVDTFEDMLMDTAQKYVVLWEALEDESPTYERFVQNCFTLLEQLDELERFFAAIHRAKIRNFRAYMLYSMFISDVLHEPAKGKKIMDMYSPENKPRSIERKSLATQR